MKSQLPLLKSQLPQIKNIILEPQPRNTAACLMLSVAHLKKRGFSDQTPVLVFPADHSIGNISQFIELMQRGISFVSRCPSLVTFGITPTHPHTGYGYIEGGSEVESGILKANRFLEKPHRELAETFIKNGNYFWNGGIFAFQIGTFLKEGETYAPALFEWLNGSEPGAGMYYLQY